MAGPRIISEERARHLRREIDVWQQQNNVFCGDQKEMETLHRQAQIKYNKFVSGLAVRRVSEHRSKVVRAQIKTNIQVLESAPGI